MRKNAQQKRADNISVRISEIGRPSKLKSGKQKTSVKSRKLGGSIKSLYCDSDGDGSPDILLRKWRSPAVNKNYVCEAPISGLVYEPVSFQSLGLTEPTLEITSGGTCEASSHSSVTRDLYCPDLEYGGFISAKFFHNPAPTTTTLRSSVWIDPKLDDWYHIVFTRSGNTGSMYINGGLVSVGSVMDTINGGPRKITVGAVARSTIDQDATFNGRMDQITVLGSAITSDQVKELYNDGSGLAYDSWSDSLKNPAEYVLEFPNADGFTDRVNNPAAPTLLVEGDTEGEPYIAGGKVSANSFTPIYKDELQLPLDVNNAKSVLGPDPVSRLVLLNTKRHALRIPRHLDLNDWALSVWVSPHGIALSEHDRLNMHDPNRRTFDAYGSTWQASWGSLFSDYNSYSNTYDANFSINFEPRYQHTGS